jgi:hypothetical protein
MLKLTTSSNITRSGIPYGQKNFKILGYTIPVPSIIYPTFFSNIQCYPYVLEKKTEEKI